MAGHSKWANIRHRKSAQDSKRGKIFTKIIKEITVAAKIGGGDINANPRLRKAVSNARSNNMPQENINRAIQKGTGELDGVNYVEITYEGYGPGGVAILIDAITDNRNRTVADVRSILNKYNGNMGENGSVSWMFERRGEIILNRSAGDEETVFEVALNCGADDFEADENIYIISTEIGVLMDVRDCLESKGFLVKSAEVEMVAKSYQKVSGKDADNLLKLMNMLEDNEDVNHIYSNFYLEQTEIVRD
ncbi:MAG: YebC/PmpR family DNA-binding transcriptional regulator [Candidatus Neomarinimicrobiota bacterium]|jgi:YebC/PmpR family DNA-binding regulatory protein|nr:YebC/PmpR family DNA-binding transcriptional regulator [Candidatus Neomarinimicrobiota bacterium]|tara:strand:+ start:38 stop:781 length:744 start_codon:yes stop_codon:yes gene_type:complete